MVGCRFVFVVVFRHMLARVVLLEPTTCGDASTISSNLCTLYSHHRIAANHGGTINTADHRLNDLCLR